MGGGYAQDQSALLSNVMVRKSAPGTDDERKAVEAAWKAYAEANDKLTKLQAANKKLAEEYGISLTDVFAGHTGFLRLVVTSMLCTCTFLITGWFCGIENEEKSRFKNIMHNITAQFKLVKR